MIGWWRTLWRAFSSKKQQQKESWQMTAKDCALWRSLPAANRDLAFCAGLKGLGELFQLFLQVRRDLVRRELGPKEARSGLLALSFPSQQSK